jgi:hypothetical protein
MGASCIMNLMAGLMLIWNPKVHKYELTCSLTVSIYDMHHIIWTRLLTFKKSFLNETSNNLNIICSHFTAFIYHLFYNTELTIEMDKIKTIK